jgi:hypothetical protein
MLCKAVLISFFGIRFISMATNDGMHIGSMASAVTVQFIKKNDRIELGLFSNGNLKEYSNRYKTGMGQFSISIILVIKVNAHRAVDHDSISFDFDWW